MLHILPYLLNIMWVNEGLSATHTLSFSPVIYYQADFLSFAFYFYIHYWFLSVPPSCSHVLLCTDLPAGSPAGLYTHSHLMKQRMICAWGSNTEKEQDEHMSLTWNCTPSNTLSPSNPVSSLLLSFFPVALSSPLGMSCAPYLSSASFSDRSLYSRLSLPHPTHRRLLLRNPSEKCTAESKKKKRQTKKSQKRGENVQVKQIGGDEGERPRWEETF